MLILLQKNTNNETLFRCHKLKIQLKHPLSNWKKSNATAIKSLLILFFNKFYEILFNIIRKVSIQQKRMIKMKSNNTKTTIIYKKVATKSNEYLGSESAIKKIKESEVDDYYPEDYITIIECGNVTLILLPHTDNNSKNMRVYTGAKMKEEAKKNRYYTINVPNKEIAGELDRIIKAEMGYGADAELQQLKELITQKTTEIEIDEGNSRLYRYSTAKQFEEIFNVREGRASINASPMPVPEGMFEEITPTDAARDAQLFEETENAAEQCTPPPKRKVTSNTSPNRPSPGRMSRHNSKGAFGKKEGAPQKYGSPIASPESPDRAGFYTKSVASKEGYSRSDHEERVVVLSKIAGELEKKN